MSIVVAIFKNRLSPESWPSRLRMWVAGWEYGCDKRLVISSVRSRRFLELSDAVLKPSTSHVFRHLLTPYQTLVGGFKRMSNGFVGLPGNWKENRCCVVGDATLVVNLNPAALTVWFFKSLPLRIVVYGRSLSRASSKDSDAAYLGTSAISFDARVSLLRQPSALPAWRHDSSRSIEFLPLVPSSDTMSSSASG